MIRLQEELRLLVNREQVLLLRLFWFLIRWLLVLYLFLCALKTIWSLVLGFWGRSLYRSIRSDIVESILTKHEGVSSCLTLRDHLMDVWRLPAFTRKTTKGFHQSLSHLMSSGLGVGFGLLCFWSLDLEFGLHWYARAFVRSAVNWFLLAGCDIRRDTRAYSTVWRVIISTLLVIR